MQRWNEHFLEQAVVAQVQDMQYHFVGLMEYDCTLRAFFADVLGEANAPRMNRAARSTHARYNATIEELNNETTRRQVKQLYERDYDLVARFFPDYRFAGGMGSLLPSPG